MSWIERAAGAITGHSRLIIAVLLLVTMAIGAGASGVEESSSVAISDESDATRASDYVSEHMSAYGPNTTTMVLAVRDGDGNVLSRTSLIRSLEFQQRLRDNETVNGTLVEQRASVGVSNVVARTAIRQRTSAENGTAGSPPPLDAQISQLESMTDAEVAAVVERVLDENVQTAAEQTAIRLVGQGYEPGSTTADARLLVVTQQTEKPIRTASAVSEDVSAGQVAARQIAGEQDGPESYLAIGAGLVGQQETAAVEGSMSIVGPLALLFVLVTLSIAYRDLLDVVLGLVGVVMVLVWAFGTMGWLGIDFNQVMIAVPILLIGLSVDYAFHVVMRYREERESGGDGVRPSMRRALSGIGAALVLVTITTAIGFLGNLTSPLADLREFGIAAAAGIVSTLFVFGMLVPALKTEIDSFLEGRGWDRSTRSFGSSGRLQSILGGGATLARRVPVAVLALAVLLSAVGMVGATTVDTSYSAEAFLADDPPAWTENIPSSFQPGEFFLKDNRDYIYGQFQTPDQQGQILLEGAVTEPNTLEAAATAEETAAAQSVTVERPSGDPAVASPLSAMERVAARNETFNATFHGADTDGNGVPDQNLSAVYGEFFAAAPDVADRFVHRSGGEYVALKLRVAVDGNTDGPTITDALSTVANTVEAETSGVEATATGRPVVTTEITEKLMSTVVQGLAVTIGAVFVLLVVVFRIREGSASLGAVTLLPVVFTVSWLLGTMALLEIPVSVITALVGSIAVGLGVDYTIHVTERFSTELAELPPQTALRRTVVGTGGALLSSAITTAAGFGVLAFALFPGLQQFGLLLAISIGYAFFASVFVQPSVLALWSRYGPSAVEQTTATSAASDD